MNDKIKLAANGKNKTCDGCLSINNQNERTLDGFCSTYCDWIQPMKWQEPCICMTFFSDRFSPLSHFVCIVFIRAPQKHLYFKVELSEVQGKLGYVCDGWHKVIRSVTIYENTAQKYIHHFRKWRNECVWQIKSCKTIALRDRAIIYQGKRQGFFYTYIYTCERECVCAFASSFHMFNFESIVVTAGTGTAGCIGGAGDVVIFSFHSLSLAIHVSCECGSCISFKWIAMSISGCVVSMLNDLNPISGFITCKIQIWWVAPNTIKNIKRTWHTQKNEVYYPATTLSLQ